MRNRFPVRLLVIAAIALATSAMCVVLYKEFAILSFDGPYAATQGWPVVRLDLAMMVLVTAVTVIGLVTVTALIGQGGVGFFILRGLQRFFSTEIVLGTALSVVLAVVVDFALLLLERSLTPWARRRTA